MATAAASQAPVPATPRVISPSPTPSERREVRDGYFGPVTRSVTRNRIKSPPPLIDEAKETQEEAGGASDSSLELDRARTRSRSPVLTTGRRRGLRGSSSSASLVAGLRPAKRRDSQPVVVPNGKASNGHLSPASAVSNYWRDLSRSPSPLGLIPIHRHWRSVIHRHEIPRKILHVSIGFFTLYLYTSGARAQTLTPYILSALIPIFSVDYLRHRFPALNRVYIRVLGALMRESEVDGWNGVIWYLLGTYLALQLFPKDVGVMSVLLLSWCDTAASTIGRAYGRHTPRLRRGKSLAGSVAAALVGALTAAAFWGWLAPRTQPFLDDPNGSFMFTGRLRLPPLPSPLTPHHQPPKPITATTTTILTGPLALVVMSLWTGLVGAASEVVDLWGWDDNLTIPVLSGLGLWSFLKVFGG